MYSVAKVWICRWLGNLQWSMPQQATGGLFDHRLMHAQLLVGTEGVRCWIRNGRAVLLAGTCFPVLSVRWEGSVSKLHNFLLVVVANMHRLSVHVLKIHSYTQGNSSLVQLFGWIASGLLNFKSYGHSCRGLSHCGMQVCGGTLDIKNCLSELRKSDLPVDCRFSGSAEWVGIGCWMARPR